MKPSMKAAISAFALYGLTVFSAQASSYGVSVALDNARPITLRGEAVSVVIGNPAIADIYVQDSRHIFVLGRSYGTTNLVAIDKNGNEIANMPVTVTSGREMSVTLHRGPSGQVSYACNGRCERTLVPSDNPEGFKTLMDAVNGKTSQGDAVAEAASTAGK